jgi:hypothetical protein
VGRTSVLTLFSRLCTTCEKLGRLPGSTAQHTSINERIEGTTVVGSRGLGG